MSWNAAWISETTMIISKFDTDGGPRSSSAPSDHLWIRRVTIRVALTGKHNTLVRRAPSWQGAPDGQQAKKLVVTKCLFYIINVLI